MLRVPDQTSPVLSLPVNSHFPIYAPLLAKPWSAAGAGTISARLTAVMVRRMTIVLVVDMTFSIRHSIQSRRERRQRALLGPLLPARSDSVGPTIAFCGLPRLCRLRRAVCGDWQTAANPFPRIPGSALGR